MSECTLTVAKLEVIGFVDVCGTDVLWVGYVDEWIVDCKVESLVVPPVANAVVAKFNF